MTKKEKFFSVVVVTIEIFRPYLLFQCLFLLGVRLLEHWWRTTRSNKRTVVVIYENLFSRWFQRECEKVCLRCAPRIITTEKRNRREDRRYQGQLPLLSIEALHVAVKIDRFFSWEGKHFKSVFFSLRSKPFGSAIAEAIADCAPRGRLILMALSSNVIESQNRRSIRINTQRIRSFFTKLHNTKTFYDRGSCRSSARCRCSWFSSGRDLSEKMRVSSARLSATSSCMQWICFLSVK